MRSSARVLAGVILAGFILAGAAPAATVVAASTAARPSDFNGDGYADLAIGAVLEDQEAGSITVLYGSSRGLTADASQRWSQDTPGIKSRPKRDRAYDGDGSHFGSVMASGDFDRDGQADLAVGVPSDSIGGIEAAGSVIVLYGTRRGLTVRGSQRLSQANLPGAPEAGDGLGARLAAGDFDGDSFWDLAIGAFGEDDGLGTDPGIVQVVYGGPDGLSGAGSNVLTFAMTGADRGSLSFPAALVAGDLDADGADDLAVGAPDYSCNSSDCVPGPDTIVAYYGSPDGLRGSRTQVWSGLIAAPIEIGDFDGDDFDDLAAGVPGETPGEPGIAVLYGSSAGASAQPTTIGGFFGHTLAAGDFDGDGADELAIGAPFRDVGDAFTAGIVSVLRGSPDGLTATGAQRWTQASPGVPGAPEDYDEFGTGLAAADFGHSGRDDLAIGAPGEEVHRVWRAGIVDVLYGRASGLDGSRAQAWAQDTPGVPGANERYDSFGASLTP